MRFPRLRSSLRDERGQDLIEYAVIATFVALLAIIGASALNAAVGNLYDSTSQHVNKGANFSTTGSASTSTCGNNAVDESKTKTPPAQTDDAHRPTCK